MQAFFIDLRYRLEYAALMLLVGIVRAMPIDLAAAVSARIWRFICPKLHRHKRALDNLAIAYPEKTPAEREDIALAMWGNLGRVMAETMQIDRIIKQPDRIEFTNYKVFARYKDKLGPVIGASLHLGNWELAIWPLVISGVSPAAVYRTVKNPYVDQFLRFLACTAFLSNMDSVFTTSHNVYIYLDPESNKFVLSPWDLDLACAGFPLMEQKKAEEKLSLKESSFEELPGWDNDTHAEAIVPLQKFVH